MAFEGTSVGLDVHARSVVAAAIDEATGEISRARLVPDSGQVLDWLLRIGELVAVVV
jgi:transposase